MPPGDRSTVETDEVGEPGAPKVAAGAVAQDPRWQRLYAAVGIVLFDALLDAEQSEALLSAMLDLAPEYVPPYCGDVEDDEAWERLVDAVLPGVRPIDGSTDG